MQIDIFGHTDIGNGRERNEDSYICLEFSSPAQSCLAAVADGMGGHSGGEVASSLAIKTLKERIDSSPPPHNISDIRLFLQDSFKIANQKIFRTASQEEQLKGMGTTLVAALMIRGKTYIANVGDSRAYFIRDENLDQITRDHTWKEDQLSGNSFSKKEISESPFRNMVTRSLGFESQVKADIYEEVMKAGDYLLLCSDGLYNPVSSKKIRKIFKHRKSAEEICRKLIQSACRSGGKDNITAVVIKVTDILPEDQEKPAVKDTVKIDFPAGKEGSKN